MIIFSVNIHRKSIFEEEDIGNILYILKKAELVISSLKNEAKELVDFFRFGS